MLKRDFKKSIRYKFLKDISIILFAGTCVLSAVIGKSVGTMLEDSLTSKGLSLATNIAKRNENALIMNGSLQLTTVYSELITDEEIIYTVIEDNSGKFLTTQFESINYKWPRLKDILTTLPKDSELPDIIAAVKKQAAVRELAVPIRLGTDILGKVTIGMSEHKIRKQIGKTVLFILALNFMVAFVLGLVLFITSKNTILDPIIELGHTAARFAKGDLAAHAAIKSMGEIQMLVDSFNQMAEDLQKTTVSRNYVDSIIRSMMDTLIVVSPEGKIVRLNSAVCALLGYDEEELIGRPFETVLATSPENDRIAGDAAFAKGLISSREMIYLTKDGRKVPMLFSASLMYNAQNTVQGIVCVAQDITERKRDEARLKSYAAELTEANIELRNITNFFFHDMRTPLVNIKGFSGELNAALKPLIALQRADTQGLPGPLQEKLFQALGKDVPEALNFINDSIRKMDSLINSVLKLLRLGSYELKPEPVDVGAVVRTVLQQLTNGGEKPGAVVQFDTLPLVHADRQALETIMELLLDNALKYLDPHREGEIRITAEQDAQETTVHIRDNGRGIDTYDQTKIFELFRRVGNPEVPGEGMGLVYVKTLVRRHGGRIWCESEPGKGTTFSFTIPRGSAVADYDETQKQPPDRIRRPRGAV